MDTEPRPSAPNRRDFLHHGARAVAVGGIAAFATFQEVKRRRLVGDPDCVKLETCSDCAELPNGCKLDKAVAFRARSGR